MSASDEPACGSDSAIVPNQRPSTIGRDVGVDLLAAAVREQQPRVGHGEERVGRRADVGRLEPGEHRLPDGVRQLHAAELLVERAGHQPGVGEDLQRPADLGDQLDLAVDHPRLVLVGRPVVRREVLGGDLLGEVEDRVEGLPRVLGEPRALGQRLDVEPLVQQEVEVAAGQDQRRAAMTSASRVMLSSAGVTAEQVAVIAPISRDGAPAAAAAQGVDLGAVDETLAEAAATRPLRRAGAGACTTTWRRLDPDGPEPDPTERRAAVDRQARRRQAIDPRGARRGGRGEGRGGAGVDAAGRPAKRRSTHPTPAARRRLRAVGRRHPRRRRPADPAHRQAARDRHHRHRRLRRPGRRARRRAIEAYGMLVQPHRRLSRGLAPGRGSATPRAGRQVPGRRRCGRPTARAAAPRPGVRPRRRRCRGRSRPTRPARSVLEHRVPGVGVGEAALVLREGAGSHTSSALPQPPSRLCR